MKKTMYFCDLCGNELEPFYKGAGIIHRAYEIRVKYKRKELQEMTEQDKYWLKKCKEDWNYTIMVDNDEIFVVHTEKDEAVYTFSLYGYEFAKALLQWYGCDADFV